MPIVVVHSFRRGTGKSTIAVNVAALLTAAGHRVGLVDTNFPSPSLHVFFGMADDEIQYSLNDYLWGECDIEQAALDLTDRLPSDPIMKGHIFLVCASPKRHEITRMLRGGYYVDLLTAGFRELMEKLTLDILLVDTMAGLTEETIVHISMADSVAIILRPDKQHYLGTGIVLELVRTLEVPQPLLVVNEVPDIYDLQQVKSEIAENYDCRAVVAVPYSNHLAALASSSIFALHSPGDPVTDIYREIAALIRDLDV